MTIEQAIRQHLTNTVGLTALVSTRIYSWRGFQTSSASQYPYVLYRRIGGDRPHSHSPLNIGLINSMWQFDVFGKNPDTLREAERQLRRALEGFPGSTGYNSSPFFRVSVAVDNWQPEPEASYRSIITAECWHEDD